MAIKPLNIRYLTKKTKKLETVKNILQPVWPNLIISQTNGILDTLKDPKPNAIIIDGATAPEDIIHEIISISEGVPIMVSDGSKNTVAAYESASDVPVHFLSPKELKSPILVHIIGHFIERHDLLEKLESTTHQLRDLAIRDDLTGLYNKRYIDGIIDSSVKKGQRYKRPVTALLAGIDSLKGINETYGYDIGNTILSEFAMLIQNVVREVDVVARYSGDEFLAILPETTLKDAVKVAERIQNDIHNTIFADGRPTHNPTASIGISEFQPGHRNSNEWIVSVRKALIEAKHCGKDQIRTIEDAEASSTKKISEDTQLILELQTQIQSLTEETKKTYFRNILKLVEKYPFYKKFLVPHSERVAFYAERLASKIEMQPEETAAIKRGGLLHDVGKVAIDKKILLKSHSLSDSEFHLIKQHPVIGLQLIGSTLFWKNELSMILHHHEWFNGNGYPDGLHGNHIPLGARILAIAEAWDTMTTEQTYRPAMSLDKAINEIKQNAGTQFDPELASIFTSMIEN